MKQIMIAGLLLIGITSFAQNKERGERPKTQTSQERVDEMSKELDLTDKQKSDLKSMYDKREKERSTAKKEGGERPEPGQKPNDDNFKPGEENREEMKKILTDEQFEKYEKLQENKEKKRSDKSDRGDRSKAQSLRNN